MPGIDARPDLPEWNETRAHEAIAPHRSVQGGLLPALHAIQEIFGFVPGPAIGVLAHEFNLSRAEVHGVATFYHDFRHGAPAGRHVLKLCRGEACQAVGADALAASARKQLDLDWHATGTNGEWTLEPVFCLGLCACGPSAMIDGELAARLTPETLRALIDETAK
jgi:formate dehydrogenase subunit gamma